MASSLRPSSHASIALVATALITAVTVRAWTALDYLLCWLIGVNLATFVGFAYDKFAAPRDWLRIPERTLLVLALLGGSPAALLARWLLRHKTIKPSFRFRMSLVLGLQGILVACYLLMK